MTNCQKKTDGGLSSVVAITRELIGTEKARNHIKTDEARRIVARKIGVPPGALERLLAGRLVHVERIADRINAYLSQRVARQIAELEHEVHLARAAADRVDQDELLRAEAALEAAREALRRATE